jgi:hypothetical protein
MNLKFSTLLATAIMMAFLSCTSEDDSSNSSTDEPEPLVADFNVTVEGEAPNAEIVIENTSEGGSSFEWEFGEGSSMEGSTEEAPSGITVDKTGEFEIKLIVSAGSESEEKTETVTIEGNNAIITFEDVEFDQDYDNQVNGINFSVSEGEVYTDSELSDENYDLIDFYFFGCECTAISFFGADDSDMISDGKQTLMRNKSNDFTVDQFDASSDDAELATIEIAEEMNFIETLEFPHVVTFQLEDGRSGAIKCKEINNSRILVDIKVQKY